MSRNENIARRKRIFRKSIALFLLVVFLNQIIYPTAAYALTGGPTQPEITQFQQASASDMVDLFTGDFSYNIPLFELPGPNGGYPFNLSYQGAPSMDQEASWVGLGWNVNPGSIVRNMRGLPDDFNGELVTRETDMKPNINIGIGANINYEFLSGDFARGTATSENLTGTSVSLGIKIYYDNYKGYGYTVQPGVAFDIVKASNSFGAGMGFNFSFDSQDGGIGADMSFSVKHDKKSKYANYNRKMSLGLGIGYNTNAGINATISASRTESRTFRRKKINEGGGASSSISFSYPAVAPSIGIETTGGNFSGGVTIGFDPSGSGINHLYAGFSVFVDVREIARKSDEFPAYGYNYYDKKNDDRALTDVNRDKDIIVKEKSTYQLHTPILTYDYYSVNGQGTGGMFRPYRQEIGYVHEQSRMSGSGGGSLGFNIPGDGKKIGINIGFNFSDSRSGRWFDDKNGVANNVSGYTIDKDVFATFKSKQYKRDGVNNMNYEGPYYKMNGSNSTINTENFEDIGGVDAVRFNIDGNYAERRIVRHHADGSTSTSNLDSDILIDRRPRGQVITPIYNHILTSSASTQESMDEMNVKYYNGIPSNYITDLNQNSYNLRTAPNRQSHIGGFLVTNPDGQRYVYGLPAYNTKTEEHSYTAVPETANVCKSYQNLNIDNRGTPTDPSDDFVKYKFDGTSTMDAYDITDQFKSITKTPEYSHSHLLTSILGNDYVDIDGTPGPSVGDYGYWVKFNYIKVSGNYKWRTPYSGGNYAQGSEASFEDDKISFTYGEKEIWYLGSVETKTHIAVFEMSERKDGIGVEAKINNAPNISSSSSDKLYKLDKIKLYTKAEFESSNPYKIPIQTIHFEYDYSLCAGVPNNNGGIDNNKDVLGNLITATNINTSVDGKFGKLTLKAIYFTYKNDHTGKNHKYKFSYANNKNYEFQENKYDRWGTYNWYTSSEQCANVKFPYTPQFIQHPSTSVISSTTNYNTDYTSFKDKTDEASSAWCLNKIELPSGGSINVEYESDDYAYVQNEPATQMFKISSMGYGRKPNLPDNPLEASFNSYLGSASTTDVGIANIRDANRFRKVYFKFEKPLNSSRSRRDVTKEIYDNYVLPTKQRDNSYQVYLNARVKLRGNIWEDIPSYYNLDINDATILSDLNTISDVTPCDFTGAGTDEYNTSTNSYDHFDGTMYYQSGEQNVFPFGVARQTTNMTVDGVTGDYFTHGYVILAPCQIDNYDAEVAKKFHPISVNAWYYMKENLSKIVYNTASASELDPSSGDDYERIIRGGSLMSIFPQLAAMFRSYPVYCYNDYFADEIDINNSWIKLGSPDKVKYGGGNRVKKIYMKDDTQWDEDGVDEIGQVYDYTMMENRKKISSGVAAYEPMIGGEENTLKYAKFYSKNIPLKSANQTYFEGPTNEAYFPAPQVGYRKVTVRSLATQKMLDSGNDGMRGTGITVHEFYTAKDFPVLAFATDLYIDPFVEAIVPIPLIGTITDKQIVASQGYSIRLNDMHGKPKAVTTYGVDENGLALNTPTSSVEYKYKAKEVNYFGDLVLEPDNTVDVLIDDPNMRGELLAGDNPLVNGYEANIQSATLGLDYDFFYDMRQGSVKAGNGGLDFNLDLMGFGIFVCPIPLPWPSYNQSYGQTNTIVSNKIIHRVGILDEVIATDGQSTVSTKNLVFDPITGEVLLTMVNNNYDKPVYNYSVPARTMYTGMDGAYKNNLLEFTIQGGLTVNSTESTITTGTTSFRNPITDDVVPLANFVSLLQPGDEFIIQSVTSAQIPSRGYLLSTKNETGCVTPTNQLKFFIKLQPGGTLPDNLNLYKFTLVRSGMRNLVSQKLGSIVSLNTGDNYPTSGTINYLNHSPLKNRLKEDLTAIPPTTYNFPADLAQWLNSILTSGDLPLGTFHNSSFISFPNLYNYVESITLSNSTDDNSCLTCDVGEGSYSGYSITIKLKPEFGSACITNPCFARNDGRSITGFSTYYSGSCAITTHYNQPVGGVFLEDLSGLYFGSKSYTNSCFGDCPVVSSNPYMFKVKNVLQASAYLPSDIWGADVASKYATGAKGIWRPSVNYYYKDERFQSTTTPTDPNQQISLADDGVFAGKISGANKDKMFYLFNWFSSTARPMPPQWVLNNIITKYNENGIALETKDILNIYNATVFDMNNNLPVAIADNTERIEMLACNFDNLVTPFPSSSSEAAFTGAKSLKVATDLNLTLSFNSSFTLKESKKYFISAWAGGFNLSKTPKEIDNLHPDQMNIVVQFKNAGGANIGAAVTLKPSSWIYEGSYISASPSYWRKVEGTVSVPAGAAQVLITFKTRAGGYATVADVADESAYFDDIRIHPAKSIMKTFVYDPVDYRLKAELDENNFPMYYGYDASGQLSVVKVLTENGIRTIKEAYSNTKR